MITADASAKMAPLLPPRETEASEAGKALGTLWHEVRALLDPEDDEALGNLHVGAAGEGESPWAHTNHDEERVNLTLESDPGQLELNLVGWNVAQSNALKDWLQSVPGEKAVNALTDYEVVAFARRPYKKTPTSSPYWRQETAIELGTCSATAFNAGWVATKMIGMKSLKEEKPAFHLRRVWPRLEAEALGDALPSVIALEVQRLLPILREIWSR